MIYGDVHINLDAIPITEIRATVAASGREGLGLRVRWAGGWKNPGRFSHLESGSYARRVEKVYSDPWNPRLGNEATCPERSQFIVDDDVEDL